VSCFAEASTRSGVAVVWRADEARGAHEHEAPSRAAEPRDAGPTLRRAGVALHLRLQVPSHDMPSLSRSGIHTVRAAGREKLRAAVGISPAQLHAEVRRPRQRPRRVRRGATRRRQRVSQACLTIRCACRISPRPRSVQCFAWPRCRQLRQGLVGHSQSGLRARTRAQKSTLHGRARRARSAGRNAPRALSSIQPSSLAHGAITGVNCMWNSACS
jgi:hypothetical protein